MSSTLPDEDEYPYSSKPPIVLKPREYAPRPQRQIEWGVLFGWALRLALAGLVLLAIVMLPIVAIGYRAYSQASTIAELEERGCFVSYSNEMDAASLRALLCDVFGHEFFDDVAFVSAVDLHKPESAPAICRLCSKFRKLDTFSIQSDHFRFEQIAKWPHLNNLTGLNIASSKITDDDLLQISRMPKLTDLEIADANFTSVGLQYLYNLEQLQMLRIGSSRLDGTGPQNEAGFPKLQSLIIENSPLVNDQTVINLGPLPELTQVILDETQVGNIALGHVTTAGKLEHVYLSKTRVTDQGLENLARCTRMSLLDLTDTEITDAGVAKLQPCSKLTLLMLSGTRITGKGPAAIRGHELGLNIDRTEVDDLGLQAILTIPGLTTLAANETKITGTGAKLLSELTSLEHLRLAKAPLTEAGIKTLARAKIQRMDLSQTPLDNKTLTLFATNDHIEYLCINETKVTAAGVVAFYEARKKRLSAANRKETLWLECDFEDAVEPYLPKFELDETDIDGSPISDAPLPGEEQQAASDQPSIQPPQP
jgi:hypothetical protein